MSSEEKPLIDYNKVYEGEADAEKLMDALGREPYKVFSEALRQDHPMSILANVLGNLAGWSELDRVAFLLMAMEHRYLSLLFQAKEGMECLRSALGIDEDMLRATALFFVPADRTGPQTCPKHGKDIHPGDVCDQCVEDAVEARPSQLSEEQAREGIEFIIDKVKRGEPVDAETVMRQAMDPAKKPSPLH